MKRSIIIAAAMAALAAPVAAQSSAEFAVQHFNQDVDSPADLRMVSANDINVVASTRGNAARSKAYALFNASVDSASDLRGLVTVTVLPNTPSRAEDIFAQMRAESLENE